MQEHMVVMAGPRGVGKTVFLSAMHWLLTTQTNEIGFFASTDLGDGARLRAAYAQLAGHQWPQATRLDDLAEWTFTIRVQAHDHRRFDACQFKYIDYAGGLLTGEGNDTGRTRTAEYDKLVSYIQNADSILGMLDGGKLLPLVKDPAEFPTHPLARGLRLWEGSALDLPTPMELR